MAYYPLPSRVGIGSGWGASRDGGARRHQGADLFAAFGTPIFAVADGVITAAGGSGRAGNRVWLNTANQGFFYAHLQNINVKPGQQVQAGQLIGTVGNTGNASGGSPHLHFGIKMGGKWIDPAGFLNSDLGIGDGSQWQQQYEMQKLQPHTWLRPPTATESPPLENITPRPNPPKEVQVPIDGAMQGGGGGDVNSLIQKYFPQNAWGIAQKVMGAESSGRANAQNPTSSASGLFQIIKSTWESNSPYSWDKRFDPEANAHTASIIYSRRGWQPWNASKSSWGG